MTASYFAPALSLALDIARSCNIDVEPLLKDRGIDPGRIANPDSRLRLDAVLGFFDALEAQLPETSCGLRAYRYWTPNVLGVLGHAWLTSRTLRAAFERLARFSRILSEGAKVNLQEETEEGTLSLQIRFSNPELAPFLRMDGTQAMLLSMTRALAGRDFTPTRIRLAHPPPRVRGAYRALFQCPVEFHAKYCEFVIPLAVADAAVAPSPTQLEQLHDRLVLEYLAGMDERNIEERTKMAILEQLPSGRVTDATIAQSLYMTPRTLQRRLKEEGTTFKQLLTEVRSELAEQYLRQGRYSLSEISFLLGFSELSAFSRAFKRWKGIAPSAFRTVQTG